NGGKNSLNRLIRCVCGKKIGPDPRNFNQRVSLGRNDLLIRTFLCENIQGRRKAVFSVRRIFMHANAIFIRVNEIYAWCGQTPCVMSVTAVRQRASHVPLGYPMSYG
ncbi:hypothetical protein, partial [Klebsiella pneumoniae]|uniref:hypothetical protein n=1 Tax=Klebsiella pneumoniae TaxID=573 RepID=UPI0019D22895